MGKMSVFRSRPWILCSMKFLYLFVVAFALALLGVEAVLDDFYCGDQNCYDVLGVKSTAKPKEIMKAYRTMAKKYHPDVRKAEKDDIKRSEMEDTYLLLNKAYDTLKKVESRKEYDDIVADDFLYRVRKRKYYGGGKNIYIHPIFPVILILAMGSVLQHFNRNNMMKSEERRCKNQIVESPKWLEETARVIKQNKCEAEMAALKEKNVQAWNKKALQLNPVDLVLHVKPVETNEIFAVQAVKFPYTAVMYVLRFIASYGQAEKLSKKDKIAMTASAFGVSEAEFFGRTSRGYISQGDYLGDLDELLKKKLWKAKNMAKLQEEIMAKRLKKIPKHRRTLAKQDMENAEIEMRNDMARKQFESTFGAN